MNQTIQLDISSTELSENYKESQLWQKQAANALCRHLEYLDTQAYLYARKREVNINLPLAQSHDAIFINGGRGAGKTVFLKNAQKIWLENAKDNCKLHFSGTIDPTLLMDHDSFSNVVVAHLCNEIEKKANKDSHLMSKFYDDLRLLADALSQDGDTKNHIGLDRIIKYRSGNQVETLFHKFVETCINILKVNAIVIPIDDVDMSLARAFEVLDVVRRMLSCPLIIPIVSGDENLYQHMLKKHFMTDVDSKINTETENCVQLSEKLRDSYLTKIFPHQFRISLLTADRLLPKLEIRNNEKKYLFKEYESNFYSTFFTLINGEENSRDYPKPDNAREISQFIRMLPPSKLEDTANWEMWEFLRIWGQTKKHGATYTNAIAAQYLLEATEKSDYRLSKLLPFNPKLQAKLGLSWASKNFEAEQVRAIENLNEKETTSTNLFVLSGAFKDKVLRSMPPLELYTQKMTLSSPVLKSSALESRHPHLYHLYTFEDYYGQQRSRIHKVFFSRAFELLASSLLLSCNYPDLHLLELNKPEESKLKESYRLLVSKVMVNPPFYCIHAINPTKYTLTETSEEVEEETELETNSENAKKTEDFISSFSDELIAWAIDHKVVLQLLKAEQLLSLLHAVFNKLFTQLQLFRELTLPFDEHLTDSVRRFEYMTINAFASFLKRDGVVKANIASGAKVTTIRSHSKFTSAEHVFTRNVNTLVDLETGKSLNPEIPEQALLEAIWDHPIFRCNSPRKDDLSPIARLHRAESPKTTHLKEPNMRFNSAQKREILDYFEAKDMKNAIRIIKQIIEKDGKDSIFLNKARELVSQILKAKKCKVEELSSDYQKLCNALSITDHD